MRVLVIGAALALAGCSGGSSQDNVKKMLEANDPMVCASNDVQRTVLSVFASGYEEYVAGGGEPLVFDTINSTGLNKDIHEVSCSAVVQLPEIQFQPSVSTPQMGVHLTYTVRPSLGDDGEFIVNAASQYRMLHDLVGGYISMNAKAVEERAQPLTANAGSEQEFTGEEAALIASANSAWSDFRNGEPDAGALFDQLLGQLFEGGICWGEVDQSQAEYRFHRCSSNSLQKQPAPAAGSDEARCNAGDHDACMRL